eukprot:6587053-Prymnesium_polylepis.1
MEGGGVPHPPFCDACGRSAVYQPPHQDQVPSCPRRCVPAGVSDGVRNAHETSIKSNHYTVTPTVSATGSLRCVPTSH